jgi:hypothetical protein
MVHPRRPGPRHHRDGPARGAVDPVGLGNPVVELSWAVLARHRPGMRCPTWSSGCH